MEELNTGQQIPDIIIKDASQIYVGMRGKVKPLTLETADLLDLPDNGETPRFFGNHLSPVNPESKKVFNFPDVIPKKEDNPFGITDSSLEDHDDSFELNRSSIGGGTHRIGSKTTFAYSNQIHREKTLNRSMIRSRQPTTAGDLNRSHTTLDHSIAIYDENYW